MGVARVEKGEMKVKRLTKMNSDGVAYIPCHWKETAEAIDKAISRLSDIEDILGDDYDLSRLHELIEADRDGRCFVHQVKKGDKVYCIQKYFYDATLMHKKRVKCRVVDFVQTPSGLFEAEGFIYNHGDIGTTVFLNREEAEAAVGKSR